MTNVRFGVAIPKGLVERLDKVAEKLNVSRSKVIEMAVSTFINYLEALNDPSKAAIFLAIIPSSEAGKLAMTLEGLDGSASACIMMKGKYALILIDAKRGGTALLESLRKLKGIIYPIVYPDLDEV